MERINLVRRKRQDDERISDVEEPLELTVPAPRNEMPSHEKESGSDHGEGGEEPGELQQRRVRYLGGSIHRKTSRASSFTSMLENTRPIPPTAPLDPPSVIDPSLDNRAFHEPPTPAPSIHTTSIWQKVKNIASGFLMPTTIALTVALPCALVQPLKALFTEVDGWSGGRMPNAPDDKPPLSFILETASFLGGITIPSALILLGASTATLQVTAGHV